MKITIAGLPFEYDDVYKQETDKIVRFKPLEAWIKRMKTNAHLYDLHSICIQHITIFPNGKIGFMLLHVDATNKTSGGKVPGVVKLRGDSVAVLIYEIVFPNLTAENTTIWCMLSVLFFYVFTLAHAVISGIVLFYLGQKTRSILRKDVLVLGIEQFRVPYGGLLFEPPAGMLDGDDNMSFQQQALRELVEETEFVAKKVERLHVPGYPRSYHEIALSPGLLDEKLMPCAVRTTNLLQHVQARTGKTFGNAAENECIQNMRVVDSRDPSLCKDAKFMIMLKAADDLQLFSSTRALKGLLVALFKKQ